MFFAIALFAHVPLFFSPGAYTRLSRAEISGIPGRPTGASLLDTELREDVDVFYSDTANALPCRLLHERFAQERRLLQARCNALRRVEPVQRTPWYNAMCLAEFH